MLVTVPFGLFMCATLVDVAATLGGPALFADVGYWTLVAGLAAMALTGTVGLIDLWDEPPGRLRRTLIRFNLVSAGMGGLFLLACLARGGGADPAANPGLLLLELAGLVVGAVGLRSGVALLRQADDAAAETA